METPPPRYRRDTDTEDTPTVPEECPGCTNDDPQYRSNHYLSLAKFEGKDALKAHLIKQFVTLRDAGKKRSDIVNDIMAWVANLMDLYGDLVHPETGAPLTWDQARAFCKQQRDAMAAAAFKRAPAGYKWQPKEHEDWLKEAIRKYAPVAERQAGDERLEDI